MLRSIAVFLAVILHHTCWCAMLEGRPAQDRSYIDLKEENCNCANWHTEQISKIMVY